MTQTPPEVHDIVYPSPITLKEISSIVAVVELWQEEIHTYLNKSKPSNKFNLTQEIRLEDILPNLPSAIYHSLYEYLYKFRNSLEEWLCYHWAHVFDHSTDDDHFYYILRNFLDLVWDWNGGIHYVRTAKLMMRCDRFSLDEKFKIACLYCFENDIEQIWPHINTRIDLNEIYFYRCPQLFYWICCYGNELNWVPVKWPWDCIDEHMIDIGESNNKSSMEYFWKRISSKRRLKVAIYIFESCTDTELFARCILPKLGKRNLRKFVSIKGAILISRLLLHDFKPECALATWMYIGHAMKPNNFQFLVMDLLTTDKNQIFVKGRQINLGCFCSELWSSAPQHLKQPVLDNLVFKRSLFSIIKTHTSPCDLKDMSFLITILQDATAEERTTFWYKNWQNLLCGVRVDHLERIMKLCFRDDGEITSFKEDIMATGLNENILQYGDWLINAGCFNALNDLLTFCCPDTQKRRDLAKRILRSSYLDEYAVLYVDCLRSHYKLLNEFIDNVFEDAEFGTEFKNQLALSPRTVGCLRKCLVLGEFTRLMEFVESFASDEEVVTRLKTRFFDYFKQYMILGLIQYTDSDDIQNILVWLLGDEDEVAKFKRSLPIEDVFRNVAVKQADLKRIDTSNGKRLVKYLESFDYFLTWYFENAEEDSFKKRFPLVYKLRLFDSPK
ncbi:uncharacterized protein LOC135833927 [Planococcus citri]|uniref:uncharacterized protein LOC135833927 n=1 Tax=Planococcus citri TaxID=170843 RepID=UPI0031F8A8A8